MIRTSVEPGEFSSDRCCTRARARTRAPARARAAMVQGEALKPIPEIPELASKLQCLDNVSPWYSVLDSH
jgi:hypothetical protein